MLVCFASPGMYLDFNLGLYVLLGFKFPVLGIDSSYQMKLKLS